MLGFTNEREYSVKVNSLTHHSVKLKYHNLPHSSTDRPFSKATPNLKGPHPFRLRVASPLDLRSRKKSAYILKTSSNLKILASFLHCFCSGWAWTILWRARPTLLLISWSWNYCKQTAVKIWIFRHFFESFYKPETVGHVVFEPGIAQFYYFSSYRSLQGWKT